MSLFPDTNVWSLLLRRDEISSAPEVGVLVRALEMGVAVLSTGLVLQELLQGFHGPKAREQILARFSAFTILRPDREDHIDAAELRNLCRRAGVQVGTIDALLAQLCIRHDATLLTADRDFRRVAERSGLKLWSART